MRSRLGRTCPPPSECAEEATSLVFPGTPVSFPLGVAAVERYSDAKGAKGATGA